MTSPNSHNVSTSPSIALIDHSLITKQWIDWQLNQYFSLATQTSPSDFQSKYQGGQRHWWVSLADYWLNKPIIEATDDIIVHLARDDALHQSLKAIAKKPTTHLISTRCKIRTGKPLEMDAICLRDLEHKPGISLLDKAMAFPKILSLHRTHSYATLENRVFLYVIVALFDRAKCYLIDNREFEHSRRVKDVKKFLSHLNLIALKTSHFNCVAIQPSLSILPNNCLLYNRNYKVIWNTFRRLLLIERHTQDALQYQHTLWRETGRQLLGAFLSSRLPKCQTLAGSCAYIKRDMQEGRWTEHNSFPGPFQWNKCHLSFIDVWDPKSDSFASKILDYLDADQLIIGSQTDKPNKHIAIWYYHHPFEANREIDDILNNLSEKLEVISKELNSKIGGLIIGSTPIGCAITNRKQGNIIYLTFPSDISSRQESIIYALQQTMEFFLEVQ